MAKDKSSKSKRISTPIPETSGVGLDSRRETGEMEDGGEESWHNANKHQGREWPSPPITEISIVRPVSRHETKEMGDGGVRRAGMKLAYTEERWPIRRPRTKPRKSRMKKQGEATWREESEVSSIERQSNRPSDSDVDRSIETGSICT